MDIRHVMIPVTDAHVHVATVFVEETVTKIFPKKHGGSAVIKKWSLSK